LKEAANRSQGLKPVSTLLRDLFREPLSPMELADFDAVVMDPPRAGAKAQAEAVAKSKIGTVVMVSCNPATLARDIGALLAGGFKLGPMVAIDQFLWTGHLETVVVLRR
ncbi:MAG: class I SAM-dependent RNA methyltransferase, partial [Hyphomicrobiaceae bacterium]|nr:class I SAM-dependent RNA methyltransferase [Hyphomicrobiaceae bacterium]